MMQCLFINKPIFLCNEPTTASAAQCWVSGGVPQFNSSGSLLLTKTGDQVTWEMPFFAIGYTAFTNVAPTVTGTNVTFTSGSTWGNHTIEYQIDVGSGYNGTWLGFNNANLIGHTISASTGFKLKIRATTLTVAATNLITNIRVAMTTTSAAQQTNLYPLDTVAVTITVQDSSTLAAIQNARVRITTEAAQEELHLLMNHSVVHDHFFKIFFLLSVWQLAIKK